MNLATMIGGRASFRCFRGSVGVAVSSTAATTSSISMWTPTMMMQRPYSSQISATFIPKNFENLKKCNAADKLRKSSTTTAATTSRRDLSTHSSIGSKHLNDFDWKDSPDCNIPEHIAEKVLMERKLYQISPHPLHTIKKIIEDYFSDKEGDAFAIQDSLSPIVSTQANFDSLLIPPDHVSRSKSDTYYLTNDICLRTHTSAHQLELLKQGHKQFLCTGDVYRRDDIDKSHYPIFHQMEGVCVFTTTSSEDQKNNNNKTEEQVLEDLKKTLEGLAQTLFGPVECRWVDEYFPFTHPSLELEIWYQGDWLEVLGCGVMQPKILEEAGYDTTQTKAWAFGLGLERLAMVLFQIPDIRLFWTQDERFWNQFRQGQITTFQEYSKYPPCFKDVSFWIKDPEQYHVNELLDLTRQMAGDMVESVELVDEFVHPKTQLESHCYRITYRSMDRSLTNEEIDVLQDGLRDSIRDNLPSVELR